MKDKIYELETNDISFVINDYEPNTVLISKSDDEKVTYTLDRCL
jgi:hypothetical protein